MNGKMKPRIQVRCGTSWIAVMRSEKQPSGWLHYELQDGTIGLAQPKNWREEPESYGLDNGSRATEAKQT